MAKKNQWNYEATVARIEDILTEIESGDLELSEVFNRFEIAVASLQQCEDFLAGHRQRVELLLENLGES
jgi:exodeoxyribonuclease VII small subunit